MNSIALTINRAVVAAYTAVILAEYGGNPSDPNIRANRAQFHKYIECAGYCTDLIEHAIDLYGEGDANAIQMYENLISIHEQANASCSWLYSRSELGNRWEKDYQLTNEAKAIRRQLIGEYQSKIQGIQATIDAKAAAEAARRIEEYWEQHAVKKERLVAERTSLNKQMELLQASISDIAGAAKKDDMLERIKQMSAEKKALGLFRSAEKKVLQEQTDDINAEVKALTERMEGKKAEIEKQIFSLLGRAGQIDYELTKER